ncbi:hypothetical protein AB205_0008740 [Aquarana catesbeiana]|uniref:Uncharacterized protein n=1 Tax=Aquarana catesbeiana TaxID=8400 RepID=A0A2G9RWG3_AQUCT|nr:hypothetical protein AB205_0008740 [Aquarana catesbeiana]
MKILYAILPRCLVSYHKNMAFVMLPVFFSITSMSTALMRFLRDLDMCAHMQSCHLVIRLNSLCRGHPCHLCQGQYPSAQIDTMC